MIMTIPVANFFFYTYYGFFCFQLNEAVEKRSTAIRKLEKRINEIVDRIYKDFSNSVGVANIREYEENHVKAAQHVAEERLSLSNQLAKLKYQYVSFFVA